MRRPNRARRTFDERGTILPLVLALVLVLSVVGVAVLQQEASAPKAQSAYAGVRTSESGSDSAVDALVQSITNNPSWFSQQHPSCADPSSWGSPVGTYSPDGGATTLTVMCKAQFTPPATSASHDLNSYAMYAQNFIRIDGCNGVCPLANINGNVGVNTTDNGHGDNGVSVNMCANDDLMLVSYGSEVVAPDGMHGDGNECQLYNTTLFSNVAPSGTNWTVGSNPQSQQPLPPPVNSAYIIDLSRGGTCPYILPWPGDGLCPGTLPPGQSSIDIGAMATTPFPNPGNCTGSNTSGPTLAHGTYNNLSVPDTGLTLRGGGVFEFCKITFHSKDSVLKVDPQGGGRTYVLVHRFVNINGGKILGPNDTLFFIRGEGTHGTSGDRSANPNSLDLGNGNGEEHGIFVVGGDTSCDYYGDQTCQGAGTVGMPGKSALYGHLYARFIVDGGGAGVYAPTDRLVVVSVCASSGTPTTPECTTGPSLLHALVKLTGPDPAHPTVTVVSWTRNPTS